MKIVNQSFEILTPLDADAAYKRIESVARTCYKSEAQITDTSAHKMVSNLVKRNHWAMLEHVCISVKFITDRGVSHEIVRHRVASYAQESTRYCNYGADKFDGEITVIRPSAFQEGSFEYVMWESACERAEDMYIRLIGDGVSPQWARSVLPTCLKTEIVVTMNLREWMHFFNLRAVGTTGAPHPQIKELAMPLLEVFANVFPEVFGEQYYLALKED